MSYAYSERDNVFRSYLSRNLNGLQTALTEDFHSF
jgi:hypothetical protein